MTMRRTHGHTHGHAGGGRTTPEYRTWIAMKQRCLYAKSAKYPRYGGRGITICDRWLSFANFLADMGPRPAGTTLDRRDNDGNYEPGNCRWATPAQQVENRTRESFDSRSKITHCPSGHPYSGENLYVHPVRGYRKCRACMRRMAADKRDRARGGPPPQRVKRTPEQTRAVNAAAAREKRASMTPAERKTRNARVYAQKKADAAKLERKRRENREWMRKKRARNRRPKGRDDE